MGGNIFVSYRREDVKADARGIYKALADKYGEAGVFMDVRNLSGGQVFDRVIAEELEKSDVLVAVIGPNWMRLLTERIASGARDLLREEIAFALARGAIVLPVLVDRAAPPAAHELPEDIRALVARETEEVRHKYFDRDMADIIAVVEARRAEVVRASKSAPQSVEKQPALADSHGAAEREWQRHGLDSHNDAGLIAAFAAKWERADPFWAHIARQRVATLEREAAERARADAVRRENEELARRHDADWQQASSIDTVAGYETFLASWNGGPHVAAGQQKLAAIRQRDLAAFAEREREAKDRIARAEVRRWAEGPFQVSVRTANGDEARSLKTGEVFRDAGGPEMVVIRPGTFMMGEPGEQHAVKIVKPFAVGKYPITFAEWDAAGLAHKPGDEGWGRGRRPVINVNWNDARDYAAWLSKATGKAYRLLSEAEWEYCCRADTTTAYSFGDTITKQQAQFSEGEFGSANQTVEVGKFPANAFGLHDMHGNVWEWCEDPWHPDYNGAPDDGTVWTAGGDTSSRVLRGGSWFSGHHYLRSAYRFRFPPVYRNGLSGFRLARTLNP